MTHWSIRARLTMWYSSLLAAGLILFGGVVWLMVSHSLRNALDESLAAQAQGVATVISTEFDAAHPQHLDEEMGEYVEATPEGGLVEIRDPRGRAIVTSQAVALARAGSTRDGFGVQTSGTRRYRTLIQTATAGGGQYRTLVAAPLDPTEATLSRIRIVMLWTLPVVLLIASGGGYWISRRALAPVDALTAAARSTGIENLSQRLAVPASGDELARLAETWNGMLERLEGAVGRLSRFTADASHELRTPIALIRATAELTLRRERPPETYREALGQIMNESERMTRLVEDLLLVARADAGLPALPLERIELSPLVQDVCQQGEILARERQLELSAQIPEQPVFVEANDPALRRLLLLLLDNAVKYTPAGGRITVTVGSDPAGSVVAVSDTGVGIPESALPHVFERFYRVDESRNRDAGGAGLGLSIAKWIAERHHASLEAESESGRGSTFRVRFPMTS